MGQSFPTSIRKPSASHATMGSLSTTQPCYMEGHSAGTPGQLEAPILQPIAQRSTLQPAQHGAAPGSARTLARGG